MHLSNDKNCLVNYRELDRPNWIPITAADGNIIYGTGVGECWIGGLHLKQVGYAAKLEVSVISIRQLTKLGHTVLHRKDSGFILDGKTDEVLLETTYDETEGLYVVPGSKIRRQTSGHQPTTRATITKSSPNNISERQNTWTKWHRRLGHINSARMRGMANRGLVAGLKPGMFNLPNTPKCEACILGKQTLKPKTVRLEDTPATGPLERLHIDLVGPYQPVTLRGRVPVGVPTGAVNFLCVVDEWTRYTWVEPVIKRGEVATRLDALLNQVENQYGTKVKRIRWDQALEFFGQEMKAKVNNPRGIISEPPGSYAHHQNGKVERMNRTLQAAGRTSIIQAGLPEQFWFEAIKMAAYTENHGLTQAAREAGIPIRALQTLLPAPQDPPDVSHFRPFGCKVTVSLPEKLKRKILTQPRAMVGIYCGPGTMANTFRYYCLQDQTVKITADMIFHEEEFPGRDDELYRKAFGEIKRFGVKDITNSKPDEAKATELQDEVSGPQDEAAKSVGDLPTGVPDPLESTPLVDFQEEAANFLEVNFGEHQGRRKRSLPEVDQTTADEDPVTNSQGENPPSSKKVLRTFKKGRHKVRAWNFARAMKIKAARSTSDLPSTWEEATSKDTAFHKEWEKAIDEELQAHKKNGTWVEDEEEPEDQAEPESINPLSVRWIFTKKSLASGRIRFKARLVVRGFEQRHGHDYHETFSPTTSTTSIRVLLATAARMGCKIHQMDVKTAFINSPLQERVYIQPPAGFKTKAPYLRLRKALYGLKQAPRCWNDHIDAKFKAFGFNRSHSDYCIYIKDSVIVALYVDDILIVSDDLTEINKVKDLLKDNFDMDDMGTVKKFLGMEINQHPNGDISVNQREYTEKILKRFGLFESKATKTPFPSGLKLTKYDGLATAEDRSVYQQMVGSLMYASTCTRPDIAYHTSCLSRFNSNPGPEHFQAAKHVFKYLRGTLKYAITYKKGQPEDGFNLHGYTDSDWGGDPDERKSTSGYVFKMSDGAISWRSRRQNSTAASSTEAEFIASAMASKEALWLRQLMGELQLFFNYDAYKTRAPDGQGISEEEPTGEHPSDRYFKPLPVNLPATTINCDNSGTVALSKNPENMKRTKHIDIAYHFVRERVASKELTISFVPTRDMIADGLTKSLGTEAHNRHLESMGLGTLAS